LPGGSRGLGDVYKRQTMDGATLLKGVMKTLKR
jgi:hypothetical protein